VTPRPHDLLKLGTGIDAGAPAWAHTAVARTPWVVVRRATAPPGQVAVGVRGQTRSQRHATTIPIEAVGQIVTPESLSDVRLAGPCDRPALRALAAVRPHLDGTGLAWGPTGGVGFQLCTGSHSVTEDSDLDIVMRVSRLTPAVLQCFSRLHAELSSAPARIDCQLDTAAGAVSLTEIVSRATQLLLKGVDGPRLVAAEDLLR